MRFSDRLNGEPIYLNPERVQSVYSEGGHVVIDLGGSASDSYGDRFHVREPLETVVRMLTDDPKLREQYEWRRQEYEQASALFAALGEHAASDPTNQERMTRLEAAEEEMRWAETGLHAFLVANPQFREGAHS